MKRHSVNRNFALVGPTAAPYPGGQQAAAHHAPGSQGRYRVSDARNDARSLTADQLERAAQRFRAVLGAGAVLDEPAAAEFRDPFEGPGARDHQPGLVVQPGTVEEVQAAVRLAGELGVHLWTSSMGRNFGYGGSAPVVNGGVVLNLRRLDRVLEIDVDNGVALLEPGVTFHALYAELRRQDAPLMMSVPDLGWGSMVGNALDHGYGYNIHGDHAGALCGLEVVRADGSLLRTGQGAIPGSPLWTRHRRGFGPALDELFKQSNFGVVTKAGLWLAPRPEVIATGTIRCEGEADIVPLLDVLRRLLLEGVLQGIPMIVGTPPESAEEAAADSRAAGSRFTMASLRKVLRPGRWNARIGLYGHEAMVAARRAILEQALAAIPGAELELRTYPGDAGPDRVEPRDLIAAGIPNQLLLDRLRDVFGPTIGHMDFSPVLPADGAAALRAERLVRDTLRRHDLVGPFGLLLTGRSMVSASMVLFDSTDAAQVARCRTAVRELYDEAAKWGCTAYRAHVALVDHVASKQAFGDHAMARIQADLKRALDPAGILSPGNHGIG